MKIINDFIGNTPLVYLKSISEEFGVKLYGKCEFMNPSGSVKDRAAFGMINDALKKGLIKESTTIIEPTSGNTGIALAFICASLNLPLVLAMPESMSLERRQLLKAYGAKLVLTPAHLGMSGAIDRVNQLKDEYKDVFIPQQFENNANPTMHYQTTGPEILDAIDIDAFVAGVGTGGTISGVSSYIKEKKSILSVAIEPKDSAVISGNVPGPHMIQGIGAGFIPKNFNKHVVDDVVTIDNQTAIDMMRTLAIQEGLFCGISAAANVAGAIQVAKRSSLKNKHVVTILCDSGERYLSMNLMNNNGGKNETNN